MKKVFGFIVVVLIFISVISPLAPAIYADDTSYICDLYIESALDEYKPENDYDIVIRNKNNPSCFKDIHYLILEYPESIDSQPNLYSNYLSHKVSPEDTLSAIEVKFDLSKRGIGASNPGSWIIKVCSASSSNDCGDKKDSLGIIKVSVATPLPAPTLPGFPIIDIYKQKACTFQPGDKVELIVDNLDIHNLHLGYEWWWAEDRRYKRLARFDQRPEETILTIKPDETTKAGLRKFCIIKKDIRVGIGNAPPEKENCIVLKFTQDPNELKDTSCSLINSGTTSTESTPTPISSLPPCAQWVYSYADPEGRCKNKDFISKLDPTDPKNNCRLNDQAIPTGYPKYNDPNFKDRKCAEISTAVGPINTEPFGFVKSILSLLLSLSGGVTVIFIIIAGYRLMTSQGNPEAVKGAQEQLTSAIVGFLFIIFSLVILQVVGVDILRIPGFTK